MKTGHSAAIALALTLLTFTTARAYITIGENTFPDDNFRAWLLDGDNILTDEEIEEIAAINVKNRHITDLTGIDRFTSLCFLYCDNNRLTTLDISNSYFVRPHRS